jgi:Zn-dependent protease with chaperone function
MERYEKQIQALVKSLKTEIYIWFGTLAILAVMSVYFAHAMKKLEPSLTISLQSALLLLLLVGLPGVFIWFRKRMVSLLLVSDIEKRLNKYETYSRIRQAVFFVFGLLILFMYVFTIMKGAPMLFMAVLLLSMFILPSRGRVIMEAGLVKPEEEAEKNEEDMGSE